jgi:hypothetical protein
MTALRPLRRIDIIQLDSLDLLIRRGGLILIPLWEITAGKGKEAAEASYTRNAQGAWILGYWKGCLDDFLNLMGALHNGLVK